MREIQPVLQTWADQNEKTKNDIYDQHVEKMLKKLYSGRQVECINSSKHKTNHRIKGVNDDNGEPHEEDNVTQDDRETENETQECDFKIHEHNRNDDEEHKQNKKDTEIKKEKNIKPENSKEEEIQKNEEIAMVELPSEDEKKIL